MKDATGAEGPPARMIGIAKVMKADVQASNGVIPVIDSMILPQSADPPGSGKPQVVPFP